MQVFCYAMLWRNKKLIGEETISLTGLLNKDATNLFRLYTMNSRRHSSDFFF